MDDLNLAMYDSATAAAIVDAMNNGISAERCLREMNKHGVNPYHPYTKEQTGYQTLKDSEEFTDKILTYLMDLPDPDRGYEPPDDNLFPRARLWKYIYYDSLMPLLEPLPTLEQKKTMKFNPNAPDDPPDHQRGYRLFSQIVSGQSQGDQAASLRVTLGEAIPRDNYRTEISVNFMCFVNTTKQAARQGIGRVDGMWQAILQSLNGVFIDGCGVMYFNRANHPRCLVTDFRSDSQHLLGKVLTMGVTWVK